MSPRAMPSPEAERLRWAVTVASSPFRADAVDARSRRHFAPLPPVMLLRPAVAIVVGGPSRVEAPLDDPAWEVWGCNQLRVTDSAGRQRADRWFEMHTKETADDLAYVRALSLTTYMSPALPKRVPFSVNYPFELVMVCLEGLRFGGRAFLDHDLAPSFPMLSCSMAYMLALAVALGAERIGLYGVDLADGTARERTVERASVEFWIGVALGRHIQVDLPMHSRLCRRALYGVHYWDEARAVMEELAAIDYIYRRHDLPGWRRLAHAHRQSPGVLGPSAAPRRRK